MVARLHAGRIGWPAELEWARFCYEPHLERIHDDVLPRRADLIQLEQIAAGCHRLVLCLFPPTAGAFCPARFPNQAGSCEVEIPHLAARKLAFHQMNPKEGVLIMRCARLAAWCGLRSVVRPW